MPVHPARETDFYVLTNHTADRDCFFFIAPEIVKLLSFRRKRYLPAYRRRSQDRQRQLPHRPIRPVDFSRPPWKRCRSMPSATTRPGSTPSPGRLRQFPDTCGYVKNSGIDTNSRDALTYVNASRLFFCIIVPEKAREETLGKDEGSAVLELWNGTDGAREILQGMRRAATVGRPVAGCGVRG